LGIDKLRKMNKPTKSASSEIKLNPIHYVCTGGCGTVSNNPGKCHSIDCPRGRNPFSICECKNGKHGNLLTLNASGAPR
jgi:hypothetical protein